MLASNRRHLLQAAAATVLLPAAVRADGDNRPSITIAVQKIATSNTLDIINEASNVGTRHFNLYKEPLIDTDWTGDLSLRPGLAESYARIDGRTIEFRLRRGVKFHNGDEMTAQDVAFTFGERMFGVEAERNAPAGGAREPKWLPPKVRIGAQVAFPALEKIEIVDKYTVRFVNKIPDLTLEGRLSMRVGSIISERAWREAASYVDFWRQPIGTGPYKVREFKPDTYLTLDAFDDHWAGRPPIKTIRFVESPELANRINGLRAGEFDFVCDVTPDLIANVEADPRFEVVGGGITNQRVLHFDTSNPVLKDPRVRLAMSHAVDRQAIVDSLWGGRTSVARGAQFDFFGPMLIEDWKSPAFDQAKARELLAAAGYKGEPIPYRLVNNYYTNQTSTAQILAEMWAAVGLNVKLEIKENWSGVLVKEWRGVFDNSQTAFFNDPVSFIPGNFGPKGDLATSGVWSNEEFFKLNGELETSVDPARRRAAWRRMLEIIERDDPAVLVLHQTANFTAKRKDLRWKPAKTFVMDFRSRNFSAA